MTPEKFTEVKEAYIEHLIEMISETGGLFPHITIFADLKNPTELDQDKPAVIHIPIPDKYMKNDDAKDEFVDELLPEISKRINEQFIPYGIAWSSEAWMRVIEKDQKMPDNYKDLPVKKEIVIVTVETELNEEAVIYEIKRQGKSVNSDGDLIDNVKLEKIETDQPDSFGGRFSGLLKKLKD
jgi:hypothetical protein